MAESMNTEQATQAENTGSKTGVQGAAGAAKEERFFTQEDVNGIVQSRLSRERNQIAKEARAEYEQKFTELQSREMKLLVKEKLDERGMSRKLADIITCTDEDDLKQKLDALSEIYGNADAADNKNQPTGFIQVGASPVGHSETQGYDPYRRAMGLK